MHCCKSLTVVCLCVKEVKTEVKTINAVVMAVGRVFCFSVILFVLWSSCCHSFSSFHQTTHPTGPTCASSGQCLFTGSFTFSSSCSFGSTSVARVRHIGFQFIEVTNYVNTAQNTQGNGNNMRSHTFPGPQCIRMKFLRSRLPYSSNRTASFNPLVLVIAMSGDVHPQPGPESESTGPDNKRKTAKTTSKPNKHDHLRTVLINARSLKALHMDPASGERIRKLTAFQRYIYAGSFDLVAIT